MDDLQPLTYAIISIVFAIGLASFAVRFYTRAVLIRAFGWDDVFCIFTLLVNCMQQAILYVFLAYGCGLHADALSTYQLSQITLWLFIEEIWYMFTHWTLKITFLIFYVRLSPDNLFVRICQATMVLTTCFMIVNWLLAFLQCRPFMAIIRPGDYPDAVCIDSNVVLMGPSVLNIIADVIILILPIPVVLQLQMSSRRKMGVIAVISFGASSVLVAFCRFAVLAELASGIDTSFVLGKMVIVAAVEIQCAMVAVNLPSMKALYTRWSGGSSSPRGTSERYNGQPSYQLESREGGKRRKTSTGRSRAGPAADANISSYLVTVGGGGDNASTGSQEILWRNANVGGIQVTTSYVVSDKNSE